MGGGSLDVVAKPNAITQFVESVKAKTLMAGEAPPAQAVDANGLTTLVTDTFDSYVMDPKKGVFVDFSEPDCEHCKELDPIWRDVAKKAKKLGWLDSGVVIAKLNVKTNQVPEDS